MSRSPQKVHRLTVCLVRMLEDWPEMTWEDVQALYAHSSWSYSDFRCDDLSVNRDMDARPGLVCRSDLREAWELAQSM